MIPAALARRLPILDWGRRYDRRRLGAELLAAAIVTVMLVPQSLAHAMPAGLPPEAGIYASIAPILPCAVFGTSRAPTVGPVAVVSVRTAAAPGEVAAQGTAGHDAAALNLALLSGGLLRAMGALQLGVLADVLSHPVIAGFITASAILIAAGQVRHLLGVPAGGDTLPEMVASPAGQAGATHLPTLALGLAALAFLAWARRGLKPALARLGLSPGAAGIATKAGVTAGVLLSLALRFAQVARPHLAEVGLVPGTQHVRNVRRHRVQTDPTVLSVRIDESLTFPDARRIEDWVLGRIAGSPARHVVPMGSAVNAVDFSALETPESLNRRLGEAGIPLHLSEVKGPVMDRVAPTPLLRDLTGRVFLSHFDALRDLGAARRAEAAE